MGHRGVQMSEFGAGEQSQQPRCARTQRSWDRSVIEADGNVISVDLAKSCVFKDSKLH